MDPARRHTFAAALIGAGTLFLIGTIVVINRAGISSIGGTNGLNINGVLQNNNSAVPIPAAPPPARPTAVNVPYTNVVATSSQKPATSPPADQNPDASFDWNAFIGILTHASKPSAAAADNSASDAYSFIPSGLISLPEPQSAVTMPESQKPLYSWGQTAGSAILSFEDSHPNQPQILTDFIQDRQNTAKISAMKQLGADLSAVGDDIMNVDPVPAQMKTAAPALAQAYREIGRNLALIPEAKGDDATVQAILTYDKSAEAFVQKFVNVVNILQANGIKYAQGDPGSVFMFPSR